MTEIKTAVFGGTKDFGDGFVTVKEVQAMKKADQSQSASSSNREVPRTSNKSGSSGCHLPLF